MEKQRKAKKKKKKKKGLKRIIRASLDKNIK